MSVSMQTADRITAIVLLALGLAMLVGGYTMDRLEVRRIHPSSIPGLVPMILGVLMAICAGLLYRSAAESAGERILHGGSFKRLVITGALGVVYAVVLVGTIPFFFATWLFITVFALIFSWPDTADPRARLIAAGGALLLGLSISAGVSALFRYVFLVRLP